jgi:hypothetical protein
MMKRFIQILSTSLVGMSLMLGVAAADATSCTISNTGQGSTNTCTTKNTDTVTVVCDNDVNALNVNGQVAQTGNGSSNSNTLAGGVTTGSAVNQNGTTFVLGASCNGQPTPATVATAPAAGGQGGGTAAAAPAASAPAAAAAAPVKALPETGSNAVLDGSVIAVAVLGVAAVASKLGLVAYRRTSLK